MGSERELRPRELARIAKTAVGLVCEQLSAERLPGPRPGWLFARGGSEAVGLWMQVETWKRVYGLDQFSVLGAFRFEAGAGAPAPDMYEVVSLGRGTVTMLEALSPGARSRAVEESWRIIRSVVSEDVLAAELEHGVLGYRVEEDDGFLPVRTEVDLAHWTGVLSEVLPEMLHSATEKR